MVTGWIHFMKHGPGKRKKTKEVYRYEQDPRRCFVQLYKLYNSKCPEDCLPNALYLTSLPKPKWKVWYSKSSNGMQHPWQTNQWNDERSWFWGTLHESFTMCDFRYPWLFDAEVDEQLIMTRTGHSSTDGVCAYKRTSDKLRQLTSDVLNSGKQNVTPAITEAKPEPPSEPKPPCHEGKENVMVPTLQIIGGTNITIKHSFQFFLTGLLQ